MQIPKLFPVHLAGFFVGFIVMGLVLIAGSTLIRTLWP
jgi:hypothetical protein